MQGRSDVARGYTGRDQVRRLPPGESSGRPLLPMVRTLASTTQETDRRAAQKGVRHGRRQVQAVQGIESGAR